MISKTLRPAHQRSKHLKQISQHLMSDGRDSSSGEHSQPQPKELETGKLVAAPIPAAQAESDQAQSAHLALVPTSSAEVEPAAQDLGSAAAATRRHVPMHRILVVSLITLFGLWGYRYWNTEHDVMNTKSTLAGIAKPNQQESQPVVALPKDKQSAQSLAAAAPVQQTAPPTVVATSGSKPEPVAAIQQASKRVAPPPQPRFRPPSYGQYPPHPAWRPLPYYRNYPQPPFRQPLPTRFVRRQAAAPTGWK